MRANRETGATKVGDQTLFVGHLVERRWGIGFVRAFEERTGSTDCFFDLPEGVTAVESQFRVSGFGFREDGKFFELLLATPYLVLNIRGS
jgi:hypothetical protein